jgi:16S rRNA (uracil1498-N3)-methyltransferase
MEAEFSSKMQIEAPDYFHYLKNVLRAKHGDHLTVFNGRDGDWDCKIRELSKNSCILEVKKQISPQRDPPQIILYFAPIRQNRLDILIEKATEIGVLEFRPILTEFTQVRKVNLERLEAQIKEASEQSEQMHIAKIYEPVDFKKLLSQEKDLWICDEARDSKHILDVDKKAPSIKLVVGPEGGFSSSERAEFGNHQTVTLGSSILRAETAAIVAVSLGGYLVNQIV